MHSLPWSPWKQTQPAANGLTPAYCCSTIGAPTDLAATGMITTVPLPPPSCCVFPDGHVTDAKVLGPTEIRQISEHCMSASSDSLERIIHVLGRRTQSCHILPFRPVLWNICFPSEPAKTASKNKPWSISEGGRIWQVGGLPVGLMPKASRGDRHNVWCSRTLAIMPQMLRQLLSTMLCDPVTAQEKCPWVTSTPRASGKLPWGLRRLKVLYYTILYYTILYYTILYYTILYYTILYYTIIYHGLRERERERERGRDTCAYALRWRDTCVYALRCTWFICSNAVHGSYVLIASLVSPPSQGVLFIHGVCMFDGVRRCWCAPYGIMAGMHWWIKTRLYAGSVANTCQYLHLSTSNPSKSEVCSPSLEKVNLIVSWRRVTTV